MQKDFSSNAAENDIKTLYSDILKSSGKSSNDEVNFILFISMLFVIWTGQLK